MSTETELGNQQGNMNISGTLRNCLGQAEKITATYSVGTLTTSAYRVLLTKPLMDRTSSFNLQLYKTVNDMQQFSSHNELLRGFSASYKCPSYFGLHNCEYITEWRELGNAAPNASMYIREQMGHSVKSSFIHTLTMDTRNDKIVPTKGYFVQLKKVSNHCFSHNHNP